MADHWKSIANLLGAPGVDAPEQSVPAPAAEPQPEAAALPRPTAPRPAAPEKASPEKAAPEKAASETAPPEKHADSGNDLAASDFAFDPTLPIPDEALSFKSLRQERARSQRQPADAPAPGSVPRPAPPPTTHKPSSPPVAEAAVEIQQETLNVPSHQPASEFSSGDPVGKPAKRKSSWEALASMFNIKVERPKPAEPIAQPPTEAPVAPPPKRVEPAAEANQRRGGDEPLPFFSERSPSSTNPALKSMFGEASQMRPDDWGKPPVVDDVSWDDTDDTPVARKGSGPREVAADEERDEPASSRGRRRRRGRRGRGSEASHAEGTRSEHARPETGRPAAERGGDWEADEEVEAFAGDAEDWVEPESFEVADAGRRAGRVDTSSPTDDFEADLELSSGDEEPERRSQRRRRRGRGGRDRDRQEPVAPRDSELSGRRPRDPADRRADDLEESPAVAEDADFDSSRAPAASSRGAGFEEDAERGGRSRRRRRGRGPGEEGRASAEDNRGPAADSRQRPPRGPQRTPERPLEVDNLEEDDLFDADVEPVAGYIGDSDSPLETKHRNIPTWADSIQSLIAANMENRKRGDNRGAPRGRPRGRR